MYFKRRQDVLFRQYEKYGYITDNSEFGYRMIDDNRRKRGEKYVSQSGAIMLSSLDRTPKHIDVIATELSHIFRGVDFDTLKSDTIEFLKLFVEDGYLSYGETPESCQDTDISEINDGLRLEQSSSAVNLDDCEKDIFKASEFLRSIHIEIANACNERCVHCYIPHKYKTDIMDSGLFYRIIEEARNMNIIHVTLSGGEPLLHKDIIGFLKNVENQICQ